jgi:hypothetical protein
MTTTQSATAAQVLPPPHLFPRGGEAVSLLDKALEAKVTNRQKRGASVEELELAAAYLRGHVSSHQVVAALGQRVENPAGFVNGWALKALRAGLGDGRAVLTIEDPADDDFDKKHEAAKVAPLSSGKAVAR